MDYKKMTTWITKIKQIIRYFLSTEDGKYIVTELGQKIVLFDNGFIYKDRAMTNFNNKSKSATSWTNKTRA